MTADSSYWGGDLEAVEVEPNRAEKPEQETILLLEDDQMVRSVTSRILTARGYRVLEASEPQRALEIGRSTHTPIDLFLTDVMLPGMSGPEVAKQVRALHPSIRLLFMSGYTDTAIEPSGLLHEHGSFLGKPFTRTSLCEKVQEALEGQP